jgi:DNA-3-methyladenine glycosylase
VRKRLSLTFFARDTRRVAQELLGMHLVRRVGGREISAMITETEAYHGWHDTASHGHRGITKRTQPMFAKPGTIYVYLIYGMYHCFNISTVKEAFPGAVLIRGTDAVSGPGRVCRHFNLDRRLSGSVLGSAPVWIERRSTRVSHRNIQRTKRVGIEYAGIGKEWKWRYVLHTREKF